MAKELFTAIVFFPPSANLRPRKYRNVDEATFYAFCRRAGAAYANLYNPKTKKYVRRIYFT